jgi:molecular chaperone DnaJ
VQVPTLSGTKTLRVRPGTAHGTVQRLRGEGPPKLGGRTGSQEKGDIHYRFVIDVPQNLSKEQESAIEQLSKTLDGDPRAGLFENGAAPAGAAGAKASADRDAAKAGES